MIKVLLWGIGGRLGKAVFDTISTKEEYQVVGGVDKFADSSKYDVPIFKQASEINVKADIIIDFSRPDAVYDILPFAIQTKTPVVIATTGHTDKDMDFIKNASNEIAIFKATNMSLGVNLLINLCKKASQFLADGVDIEIIEEHHNLKVDSPSGTALTIAKSINEQFDNNKEMVYGRHSTNARRQPKEIGIHSVRGGTVVGKHSVLFL
ncbi:MAG: 4-hydroxy-tetrahydrodipicolinate reductase, partial [Clostridia bacterium]